MQLTHAEPGLCACSALNQGVELLFYGDSITETWRGSDMGRQCSRCAGVPDVFFKYFGSKYESEVLAVGGASVILLPSSYFPVSQRSNAPRCHG